jgi:hypothetical protein
MPTQTTEPPGTVTARLLRALIALSLACAFGIFAFAAAMGLAGSRPVAVIVAVGIAAFVAWFFLAAPDCSAGHSNECLGDYALIEIRDELDAVTGTH